MEAGLPQPGHEPEKIALPTLTVQTSPDDGDSSHSDDSTSAASLNTRPTLALYPSHISHTHDVVTAGPVKAYTSNVSIPDEIYDRLSPQRKRIIVAFLSFSSFLAPISSTTILAAIPEVADTYNTTGTVINISNGVYLVFMGLSPLFWGPMSQVYGRRLVCMVTSTLFLGCSIGTALAPNLVAYYIFRALTAFQGTAFLIVGAAVLGDIYRPTERATAMGWFLSGTLIGPALGPFLGGLIVNFVSWRVIFWLQTGLAAIAVIGSFFLLPETIHHLKSDALVGLSLRRRLAVLAAMMNPWRVIVLFRYPNLIAVGFASSSLVWNMYSLLTPIRYVLNPRFDLTSPILGGLFYLAPGAGYLLGTFFGGRWADATVKKWMRLRNGERRPEDRLRSCIPFLGGVIPVCMLIYGWSIDRDVGGVPLPVIVMFLQGVAQLFCFPSLNTYCLDVMQHQSAEVIAGNYLTRYMFAAAGTAFVLPAVESIGVGWFSTISAVFLVVCAVGVAATVRWGKQWREAVDGKRRAGRERRQAGEAKRGEVDAEAQAEAKAEMEAVAESQTQDPQRASAHVARPRPATDLEKGARE